jgi:ADP-heptose:LPS heptosyltransferase
MKILILRFSSLGDIVLSSPIIRILKSHQQHEIHFATQKEFESVLEANPYIDKIHLLEKGVPNLVQTLKKENFDIVIDLQNSLKTRSVKNRLRTRSMTFKKQNLKEWLLVNFKINLLSKTHVVDQLVEVVTPLGAKMDSLGLDYFIPEKDEVEHAWFPDSHKKGFAVLVVGSKYKTRQLPVSRMIELCDRINKPIILVGGKADVDIANEIEAFFKPTTDRMEKEIEILNKKTVIFNACGKFSINQTASIISKSNWVFTHDTSMMHIAAAFKKPIYSIWGNTIPEFGMYPYRTQFSIFENKNLKCRPCSSTGFDKCPKGHFKCMNNLIFDFYLAD